jgi:hypothetical protein
MEISVGMHGHPTDRGAVARKGASNEVGRRDENSASHLIGMIVLKDAILEQGAISQSCHNTADTCAVVYKPAVFEDNVRIAAPYNTAGIGTSPGNLQTTEF